MLIISSANAQTLLAPTGPHGVGRLVYHWQDSSRTEVLSSRATDKREVGVWLWYPATMQAGQPGAPYVDRLDAIAAALSSDEVALARSIRTHAVSNAPLLRSSAPFPILIFSPGAGNLPALYTSFVEELASHGYVVAALDHPYDDIAVLLSDGHIATQAKTPSEGEELLRYQRSRVDVRVADVRFVLNQLSRMQKGTIDSPFKRRLDLTHVGVFGHSVGGMTAAETCLKESRVKACANMDGVVNAMPAYMDGNGRAPTQPFLFIQKPFPAMPGEGPQDALQRIAALRLRGNAVLQNVRSGYSYRITVDGATHASFSDEEIITDANAMDRRQLLNLIRGHIRAFFHEALGVGSSASKRPPSDPRIHIEVFSPR